MDWLRVTRQVRVSSLPGNARKIFRMMIFLIPLIASAAFILSTESIQLQPQDDTTSGRPLNVLPLPTQYTTGKRVICLSPDFTIVFPNQENLPDDLKKAATRVEKDIWTHEHQYLSIKHGAEFFAGGEGCEYTLSTLEVNVKQDESGHVASIMDSAIKAAEERPDLEAYTLSIPLGDRAIIKSPTALGAFRGLTTFENLFYHLPADAERSESSQSSKRGTLSKPNVLGDSRQLPLGSEVQRDQATDDSTTGSGNEVKGRWYAPAAPYEIEDKPAFGWRAVMLDTSRNWFGKESLLNVRAHLSQLMHRCWIRWRWSRWAIFFGSVKSLVLITPAQCIPLVSLL